MFSPHLLLACVWCAQVVTQSNRQSCPFASSSLPTLSCLPIQSTSAVLFRRWVELQDPQCCSVHLSVCHSQVTTTSDMPLWKKISMSDWGLIYFTSPVHTCCASLSDCCRAAMINRLVANDFDNRLIVSGQCLRRKCCSSFLNVNHSSVFTLLW